MNAGRPLAFFWAVLLSECVLTAEGAEPGHGFDLKYILIGGGIGLFLAAVFLATKVCMVRRQVLEMCSGCSRKTPENHLPVLSHLSHSEHAMEMASNGSKG